MASLNEIIHQPARLRIMSALMVLDSDERIEFSALGKLLRLTDGNLGAHLQKLEEVSYIEIKKMFVDRKPRTYIKASMRGRAEFEAHVAALKEILRPKK